MIKAKKAGIGKMVGWIFFIFAVLLLVLLYKNDMNFPATVQQILGWFGS
jgi:hypothetical protein